MEAVLVTQTRRNERERRDETAKKDIEHFMAIEDSRGCQTTTAEQWGCY